MGSRTVSAKVKLIEKNSPFIYLCKYLSNSFLSGRVEVDLSTLTKGNFYRIMLDIDNIMTPVVLRTLYFILHLWMGVLRNNWIHFDFKVW